MPDNQLGNESATQSGTTPDWTKLLDPTNGKILGKYDPTKPEEAFKGHWELQNHASQVERENAALKEALEQIGQRVNPNAVDAQRANSLDEFTKWGIPAEPFTKLVDDRVNARVEAQFAPIVRTMAARTEMAAQYPEYVAQEGAVMAFVGQHPELSETYNAMSMAAASMPNAALAAKATKAALDYAYLKYREYNPASRQSASDGSGRAAAALPNAATGGAADGSRVSNQMTDTKSLEAALAHYNRTKDERPFLDEWFKGMPLTWEEQQLASLQANRR